MHLVMPELAFFFLTLPFCLWIAWTDLRFMKISNTVNLAVFGVFLVTGLFLLPLGDYGLRIGIAVIALIVGIVLNAMRAMGGGDAKFIAALIPFIDPSELVVFMFTLSVCLLAAVVVHRLGRALPPLRRATPDWVSWEKGRNFPMGLGLAGGLSFYLAIKAFNLPFGTG